MLRLSFVGLVLLALAGCSIDSPQLGAADPSFDPTPPAATKPDVVLRRRWKDIEADRSASILTLPSRAGARVLTERRYADGWRQSISLDTIETAGGWNELTIDIRTAESSSSEDAIPMGKPTRDGILREIAARFPGAEMRIMTSPRSNALGPFGLALGNGERGMRCAFAWQWIDDLRTAKAGETQLFPAKQAPASIRYRACRKGVAPEQFARWYGGLDISNRANIDRLLDAAQSGSKGASDSGKLKTVSGSGRRGLGASMHKKERKTVLQEVIGTRRYLAPLTASERSAILVLSASNAGSSSAANGTPTVDPKTR